MTKSRKHCVKRRNYSFWAISSFVTIFSKSRPLQRRQKASIWGKGLKSVLKLYSEFSICSTKFSDVFKAENIRNSTLSNTQMHFDAAGETIAEKGAISLLVTLFLTVININNLLYGDFWVNTFQSRLFVVCWELWYQVNR